MPATGITVVIDAYQLVPGFVYHILESHGIPIDYVSYGWTPHIRHCLAKQSCRMSIEKDWIPLLQRLHDDSIMERIAGCTKTTPKEQMLANKCQLWMRVITIANLASLTDEQYPLNNSRNNGEQHPYQVLRDQNSLNPSRPTGVHSGNAYDPLHYHQSMTNVG